MKLVIRNHGDAKARLRRRQQGKLSEWVQCYLMMGLQTLGFAVFGVYPILWVLRMSFYDFDGVISTFVGLGNFVRIFTQDKGYWLSVVNTLIIGGAKLVIELPVAFLLAVILSHKLPGRNLFKIVYYMPSVMSSAIMGMIFYFLFASYNGVVNNLLQYLHIIQEPVNWFGGRWSATVVIVLASAWMGIGANMIYFLAAMQSVPLEIYEAGELDGAGKIQQFWYLTVPMLAPITRIIIMLAIMGTMRMNDLVLVLTGGGPGGQTDVMMTYVFKYFFNQGANVSSQYGYAAALGFVTAINVGVITAIYTKVVKKTETE